MIAGSIKTGKTSIRVGILEDLPNQLTEMEQQELSDILGKSEGIKYAFAEEDSLHTDLMTGKYHVVLDYRDSNSINDFALMSYENEDKKMALKELLRSAIMKKENINLSSMAKKGITETERSMALLLSLFMILATIPTAAIIRDKQSGTFVRFHFAKKSSVGYVLGYIVHTFLITLVQVVLCMVVLDIVQKNFNITIIVGAMTGVLIAGIATIFSTIICLGSKSEMQANITASSLAAVMSLLGGTFVAIESMPRLLQMISMASPIRWIVELTRLL
jgi:ABC-2 type transport system permease protein